MAKNNAYINQAKKMARYLKGDDVVVDMVALFAVALFKTTNMEVDDIIECLTAFQNEWNKKADYGYDAAEYCRQETGIDVRGANNG